jgi:hypothetical protein
MTIVEIINKQVHHQIFQCLINDISKINLNFFLFVSFSILKRQENTTYYETKIQRLTKVLDDKEQELRSLNMQLITYVY